MYCCPDGQIGVSVGHRQFFSFFKTNYSPNKLTDPCPGTVSGAMTGWLTGEETVGKSIHKSNTLGSDWDSWTEAGGGRANTGYYTRVTTVDLLDITPFVLVFVLVSICISICIS